MEEEKNILPYRMNQLVKMAADLSNRMVNSSIVYDISYKEMQIVLALVQEAITQSKE